MSFEKCWIWGKAPKRQKVKLYSEVILWKMILGLTQYSLNKDHQHHKWQQQKSWISSPDCRVAQDKQLTQYLLYPCKNGGCIQNIEKFPNRNVQTFGFVYEATNGQNHGPVWKTQSFLLSKICMVILWQDCYGKGNLRRSFLKYGWEKSFPNRECFFVHRGKRLFLTVYVADVKLAGKKQNINPMWKVLNKEVDLGEPTSFLEHVYLGCTQRQCEISRDIVDNNRTMFESRISVEATEKLPCSEILSISSWSYDMEGHAMKCVERYCELANKTTQQLYKVSTPRIDDHHFKEEEFKSVGELSKVFCRIVLKCLYLARIGRPDIQWSVNKLARSTTKWTRACDKRLARLVLYIHHTSEYRQSCHVGKHCQTMQTGTFSRLRFCGRSWVFKIHFWRNIVRFWKSYICSNKLDVQGTNLSFAQFNRIRNHLFGRWIEIGRDSRSWFMGSDCFSLWKHASEPW